MISDDYDPMAEAPYDDPVEHPIHYDRGECPHCGNPIETRFVIEDMPYFRGAAAKYIIRAGKKPGAPEAQDLEKAVQCLRFEIERIGHAADEWAARFPDE